jgi:hypothetical protein
MTRKEAHIGIRVVTNMGCKRVGIIIPRMAKHQWTDGTYREPLNPRESRNTVGVKWDDGTRGLVNVIHLSVHPDSMR